MHTISIVDDVLAPLRKVVLNYEGEDPYFPLRDKIKPLIRKHLEVGPTWAWEMKHKWDQRDGSFYDVWRGEKSEDKWSTVVVFIKLRGEENKERYGKLKIEIVGVLNTKYEYSNALQKMLWLLYNRYFYYKQRRFYIEQAKHKYIYAIRDDLAEMLRIPVKEGF